MPKTLAEWEQYYRRKTGQPIKSKAFAQVLCEPDKGFMYYHIDGDKLLVFEVVGNGRYWHDKAHAIAIEHNCKQVFTTIYVEPKVYQRLFPDSKVFGTVMYWEVK